MVPTQSLLLLALVATVAAQYPSHDDYCIQFNKVYDDEEKQLRQAIYDERIASFLLITTFTPGINNFTDWLDS